MVEIEWRRVAQGKTAEFTPLANEFVEQWKKAGVEFCFAARTIYGGPSTQFAHFTGLANWAVLDTESPFHKLIGDQGFKRYSDRLTPLTAEVHRDVYRFQPGLSYLPNLKSAQK
jgi:hypothetical protein